MPCQTSYTLSYQYYTTTSPYTLTSTQFAWFPFYTAQPRLVGRDKREVQRRVSNLILIFGGRERFPEWALR